MATVALAFNAIRPEMLEEGPLDRLAEYDSGETIAAVVSALEAGGHRVIPVEADEAVAEKLRGLQPDFVFNIAEGLRGESRESHVPAICEMLGLAYTGSGPLTLALCLDKARTKQILKYYGLDTPPSVVIEPGSPIQAGALRYPLIAKLDHEGSSMGLSADSVVDDFAGLRRQVERLVETYGEPVLVEEFIEGREFTVPILGNAPPRALPIIEVVFDRPRGIVVFDPDPAVQPLIERSHAGHPEAGPGELTQPMHRSVCPAEVDEPLRLRINNVALAAYRALGCRDWCRMEMRRGSDGRLYILELNPIAGIDPSYWFARSARAASISYEAFINELAGYALERKAGASAISADERYAAPASTVDRARPF